MTGWLGVVSKEHVMRGVSLGIVQVLHGRKGPLEKMRAGDTFVYYSPREGMKEGAPVQAFTALATFPDDEVWQADEGNFQPWRRKADYLEVCETPIAALKDSLELTAGPNWGYALRRGLLELSDADVGVIRSAMLGA